MRYTKVTFDIHSNSFTRSCEIYTKCCLFLVITLYETLANLNNFTQLCFSNFESSRSKFKCNIILTSQLDISSLILFSVIGFYPFLTMCQISTRLLNLETHVKNHLFPSKLLKEFSVLSLKRTENLLYPPPPPPTWTPK